MSDATTIDGTRGRRKWAVFAVLAGAAALTILDVSKLGIALPAIQADMGGDPATVQFMLVGYTLAYAAMLLPAGRIGDVVPRRTVFLTGMIVFVASSVACTFAPTIEWLVAARVIEGLGAGLLMPQVLGLIQRVFPAGERAKPLAALAAITSLTSLGAPVLAGFIMDVAGDQLGWRLLFLVTVVAGAIILPFAFVVVHEPVGERRRGYDTIGTVLLAVGVVLTIGPLSAISGTEPPAPWIFVGIGLGIAFLAAFIAHERRVTRRGREPLVDPELFRLPHLPAGVLISGCMHAAATAGTLVVTIALQQLAHLSALETAMWMLPAAAASLLGSWIATRVSPTNGHVVALGTATGALALAGSGLVFGAASTSTVPPLIAALLCVSAFGSGLSAPANQARTLLHTPGHRSSVAGSLIQFAQRTGSAIGMALALIIYYAFFSDTSFAGRPASGAMWALWAVSVFLVVATVIAVVDHARTPRVELEVAEPEPQFVP
ncbi:MFS transporter [Microbacterium sp. kSW2-24]|uniref:MFS transporter n=1 Tax=Microbacterium galbinum TaxID=2851646 RepID=UPI001FFCE860|nr:MFS transporter [Microbacterium galbinum]MCK2023121.1 MFS transporter [Microbacterium galbinum]